MGGPARRVRCAAGRRRRSADGDLRIPERPPPEARSVERAAADFFTLWFDRQSPSTAAAYYAPRSFACVRGQSAADTGFARYRIAGSLEAATRVAGPSARAAAVLSASAPWDPALPVVRHRQPVPFLLVRIPEAIAPAFDCVARDDGDDEAAARVRGRDDYAGWYGVAADLRLPGQDVRTLLWRQMSTNGGRTPLWSRDGKELFFVGADGDLMTAKVEATGTTWNAGQPVQLFGPGYFLAGETTGRSYDLSADGKRFVMIKYAGLTGAPPSIIVVQHFNEELKRVAPVN